MNKKIFQAKKIITMNPSMPEANYIAVDGDQIVATGPWEAVEHLDDFSLDTRFADKVILPGFVEGHSHALEGGMWDYLYLGFYPRYNDRGEMLAGVQSETALIEAIQTRLAELPIDAPLIAWGFDPLFLETERLNRYHLDRASTERPIVIFHASLHVMTVNTKMLELADLDTIGTIEGIKVDAQGVPTGELQEIATMHAVQEALDTNIFDSVTKPANLLRYAKIANNVGVTTVTDLYNPLSDTALEALHNASQDPKFNVRIVPAFAALSRPIDEGITRVTEVKPQSNQKLHLGAVKVMTDGSIQGYTARLLEPGYHDGNPNGLWNAPPETITDIIQSYHQAGLQMHIHTNGDEAVELVLDAIEQAMTLWPNPDHRHTLQHCQIINHTQLRRAKKLGVCLNMFANHIYYWGDIHRQYTLGYERTERMEPLASALKMGIPVAAHSDAPITPIDPLFTAWCAVTRQTSSGVTFGEPEKLTVAQALEMITLGAAYTLKLDHLVGSLEIGKYADMAVLNEDPLEIDPNRLKDMQVCATVFGGEVYEKS